jgi:hypothetical protein
MHLSHFLLAISIALGTFATPSAHAQSTEPLPELAQGLPQDWAKADAIFKERVHDRFRIGEPEQNLIHVLIDQGFAVSPDRKSASFEQPDIVCRLIWRVFWATDEAQNIRSIGGVYGGICL